MLSFADLIQQGTANAWLFIPSAILLGALHGLEPGHSKTLMAAFIVAIRGTVAQAVMLGVAATISHTAIVWGIALGGMYIWRGVAPEAFEPWLQLVSGIIILAMAFWMLWVVRRERTRTTFVSEGAHAGHDQDQAHDHDHAPTGEHHHHDETRRIDTGHGVVELSIFEDGVPPRWRLKTIEGQRWFARDVIVITSRPDGTTQKFAFRDRDSYLESYDDIPEPHEFKARLSLGHGGHSHDYDLTFAEGHGHHGATGATLDLGDKTGMDAHALAHASDIERRFAGRTVTNGQIIIFGLTGGLIPCPAAITVLLVCLQLKEFVLGAALVLCFSIGLAITLVAVGAAAALSVKHATKRLSWLNTVAARAPYVSGALILVVGVYMMLHGLRSLALI